MRVKEKRRLPANGEHFVGMILGGRPAAVEFFSTELAKVGVLVRYVWPIKGERLKMDPPSDVEVVIVLASEALSRDERQKFVYRARQRIPVHEVNTRDELVARMWDSGFRGRPLPELLDQEVEEVRHLAPPAPPVIATPPEPEPEPSEPEPTPEPLQPSPSPPPPREEDMAHPTAEQLAAKMRKYREVTGITQREIARKAGVNQTTVSLAERGLTVGPESAVKLERVYGLPAGSLQRWAKKPGYQATSLRVPRRPSRALTPAPSVAKVPAAPVVTSPVVAEPATAPTVEPAMITLPTTPKDLYLLLYDLRGLAKGWGVEFTVGPAGITMRDALP